MNRITLRRDLQARAWVATWEGSEADAIRRLFGTTTLPTGFTPLAEPETVVAAIQAKNPGYVVEVAA